MFEKYGQKTPFTEEDKRQCLPVCETLLSMHAKSVRKGLLSIEEDITGCQDFFLKKAYYFALEAKDPNTIREILLNYIYADNLQGRELLKKILITESVLMTVRTETPAMFIEKLMSFFGMDFTGEFKEYFKNNTLFTISAEFITEKFEEDIKGKEAMPEIKLLDEKLQNMSDSAIQKLLRYTNMNHTVAAFCGLSEKSVKNILKNMSKKNGESIMEMYYIHDGITPEIIAIAQENILVIIDRLTKSGETLT